MTYRSQARQLETKKTYPQMVSKMKSEAAARSKIIFALSQNPPKSRKNYSCASEKNHSCTSARGLGRRAAGPPGRRASAQGMFGARGKWPGNCSGTTLAGHFAGKLIPYVSHFAKQPNLGGSRARPARLGHIASGPGGRPNLPDWPGGGPAN